MFIVYLNKSPYFYSYKYNVNSDNENDKWSTKTEFNQGLFDFQWETSYDENCQCYPMVCIALDGNIKLQAIKYTISDSEVSKNTVGSYELIQKLSYSNAYFINTGKIKFYYTTYNKNPREFKSGYSLGLSYEYVNSFTSGTVNTESPLDFFIILQLIFFIIFQLEKNNNRYLNNKLTFIKYS